MGLWDTLGNMARKANEGMENYTQQLLRLQEEYASKSTDQLRKIFLSGSSSTAQKLAAGKELRNRGEELQ